MADTITLYLWEVDLLYALMCQQLKVYCQKEKLPYPDGDTIITGKNKPPRKNKNESEEEREKREHTPSLTRLISEHPDVVEYLKSFNKEAIKKYGSEGKRHVAGSRIYELILELDDSTNQFREVPLRDIYRHVYFLFLGYRNVDEFRAAAYVTNHFTCYYYSMEKKVIFDFRLSMFFTRETLELKFANRFRATLSGLDEIGSNSELHGLIEFHRDSWNVRVTNSDLCLNLSVHSVRSAQDKDQVPVAEFFYGFITGTNTNRHLFGAEIIMANGKPGNDAILKIHRYLNLRRNYASLNMTEDDTRSVDKLQINNISINRIEHYANKTYRLFTSTPSGAVLQSRFSIADDYSSTICVPGVEKGEPLQCRLSLDNINEDRLVVFAYREKFVLYTINSIEFSVSRPIKKILKGAFCVADGSVTASPIGNIFVMSEDNSGFEPQLFQPEEIGQLRKDEVADSLLAELWNEKPLKE